MNKLKTAIISGLFIFILTVGSIEASLRLVDPLGIRYFDDLAQLYAMREKHDTGYTFPDGEHRLSNYAFTYRDGVRVTPDSNPDGRRVVFIGDSLTFGMGVNDNETWANLVSSELQLNAINLALPAYNIGNIERQIARLPANACIVWLIVGNDHEPDAEYEPHQPSPQYAFITRYLMLLAPKGNDLKPDAAFYERVNAIADDPRVISLTFDTPYADAMSSRVHRIPLYTKAISYVDGHPNTAGNREIAGSVTPVLAGELAARDCDQR